MFLFVEMYQFLKEKVIERLIVWEWKDTFSLQENDLYAKLPSSGFAICMIWLGSTLVYLIYN